MKLSVVIPIYEQWQFVPVLLDRLSAQSYPEDHFEVVLVDNGSSKICLPDIIATNVIIVSCNIHGAYAARNHGVKQARGDWVVFTDADCLPAKHWLSEIARYASTEQSEDLLVAGCIEALSASERPTASEIYDIVRGIPQAHYVKRGYAATANLAVPRDLIDQLGGFNEDLYSGGDADFCRRARSIGFRIKYVSSAVVQHRTRTCWHALVTKARRVKGGQLTCKSVSYKFWVFVRTILSPIITIYRFSRAGRHPKRYRLIASIVYMRLWRVEIKELFRVALGGEPERR